VADREALLAALDAARDDFQDALADVDLELATVPGVMEEWSVRDLVHHVAVWCVHGSEAIDLALAGRGEAFDYSKSDTDGMNARALADARSISPDDALAREGSAFDGLRRRVSELDAAVLELRLGNGDTVAEVIAYDGPNHYAEHTTHLRAWFGADED
jgi:hypothetical protein